MVSAARSSSVRTFPSLLRNLVEKEGARMDSHRFTKPRNAMAISDSSTEEEEEEEEE